MFLITFLILDPNWDHMTIDPNLDSQAVGEIQAPGAAGQSWYLKDMALGHGEDTIFSHIGMHASVQNHQYTVAR